eukprot:scaffold3007_cov144-Skeletonema_dohrnii-CCMP3373.AAC.12
MVSVGQSMFKFRRSRRVEADDDDSSSAEHQQMSNGQHNQQETSAFSKVIGASKAKQKASVPNPTRKKNSNLRPRSSSKGAASSASSSSSSNRRSRSSPPPRSLGSRGTTNQQQQRRRGRSANYANSNSSKRSIGTEKTATVVTEDDDNSVSSSSGSSSGDNSSYTSSSSSEESGTVYSELDESTLNESSNKMKNSNYSHSSRAKSDDDASYPSVGVNVIHHKRGKNNKPAVPNPGPSSRQAAAIGKQQQQQHPIIHKDHGLVESLKMKPPSVLGTSKQKKQHRRNKSSGDGQLGRSNSGSSIRSVKSTGNLSSSEHSTASSAERSQQEHAAMQQLAFLVVQLRSDLREATLAKEEVEEKLEQAHQQTRLSSASAAVMSGGDAAKVRQMQQENDDLQTDIDVFIAEQEDLQKEIERLKEEKAAANDVIKRLRMGSMGGSNRSLGGDSSAAASASLESKNEVLETRVQELTDENHKLEKQIQLLVDEKQSFTRRDMEIDTLKKAMQEKDSQFETKIAEMQAQMAALETAKSEAEKDAKEQKMNVALVEDQLEAREKEFETEGKKMTLVRQRLTQVEKQKAELVLKNESMEQSIAAMKEEEQSSKAVGTAVKASNEKVVLELQEKISSSEQANSQLEDELSAMKLQAETDAVKLAELETKVKSLNELSDCDEDEQITSLSQKISKLEDAKEKLETEAAEASDAIAMLEDELDSKDVQTKEALDHMTNLQQQFSTKDTQISTLTKRNEELTNEIEELNKQVKVLILEKKIANEEVKALKKSQITAEAVAADSTLKETNQKLLEELEESTDAICMLKEALTELEDARTDSDTKIVELEAELERKDNAVKAAEASSSQLQSEHQVNIHTISTLQKMIQSLEKSKDELEDELTQSTMALHEMKEDIRTKDSVILVKELESKLVDAEKKNEDLSGRIVELASANEDVENKVKDLGESVFSLTRRNSTDRAATCDALILELKNQITELVTERNAALEKVASLKNDDCSAGIKESSVHSQTSSKLSSLSPPPVSLRQKVVPLKPAESAGEKAASSSVASTPLKSHQAAQIKGSQSIEFKPTKQKSNRSSSISTASRGSSLLEAAKKLCNKLDEKRGINNNENESENPDQDVISKEESEDDDNSSAKELKMDPVEPPPVGTPVNNDTKGKKSGNETNNLSRGQKKYDIDQLTSIYFERCGSEGGSKLSDLSSEGRSSPRERKEGITTRKVKICRNGVFMGTYEGDLNKDGQRHGFGVLICDNGNSYEGEWKKDKRDGVGIARYSSGDVYDGEWLRGKRQGHGVMYIEAGDTYIGSWTNGLKHGAGTYHWADGEVDVSWYQEDRRVGEGVRWNSTRTKAYRLVRGTKKEEMGLDEAYTTAESLGLNLEKVDSSESS